jgi:transcription initiation factor TFIID subunit TAF12
MIFDEELVKEWRELTNRSRRLNPIYVRGSFSSQRHECMNNENETETSQGIHPKASQARGVQRLPVRRGW